MYSDEELIEELERVSEEHCDGESPKIKDMREYGNISVPTFANCFGSWNESLNEAGFKLNRKESYNKEKLTEELKRISEEHCNGKAPKTTKVQEFSDISVLTFVNNLNGETWKDILKNLDFDTKNIRRIVNYDNRSGNKEEEAIKTVKNIAKEYHTETPTWRQACNHNNSPHPETLQDRTGLKWRELVQEANLETNDRGGLQEKIDKDVFLNKVYEEFDEPPSQRNVREKTAIPHFYKWDGFESWTDILIEAGFEKDELSLRHRSSEHKKKFIKEKIRKQDFEGGFMRIKRFIDEYQINPSYYLTWKEENIEAAIEKGIPKRLEEEITEMSKDGLPSKNKYKNKTKYSWNVMFQIFGSWKNFLQSSGVITERRERIYREFSDEDLLDEIKDYAHKYYNGKRPPSITDFENNDDYPSQYTVFEHFGSWNNAVEQAGFDPNESPSGKEHPHWKGGEEEREKFYYGPSWTEQRKKEIRSRDNYECRVCDISSKEHHERYGRELPVHHIKPARTFEDTTNQDEEVNGKDNLITLCCSCHRSLEGKWQDNLPHEFAESGREYLEYERSVFDF